MPENQAQLSDRETNLLRVMTQTSWKFYWWVAFLLSVSLWGLFAYVTQLRQGLAVTGLRDQISWGLYITDFVFFIGISHAGTLISAILRLAQAEWRRPITRLAEGITVFALCIGGPMVIIDMGRPDRMLNLFWFGRIQSPILWDVIGVSTYLTGCILYFFIPMIPDLALLSTRSELPNWRRRLFKTLSLGWVGSPAQWKLLERAISAMAVFIIPLAISVHTVVSWIFAMTLRPGWNASIFGPYFVTGAIYSGIAAVIISMFCLRKVFKFEDYIQQVHFRNLGLLLLSLSLIFLYFNINEYLTVGYKNEGMEKVLLSRLFSGDFSPYFKTMLGLTTVGPTVLLIAVLGIKRWRIHTIPGTVLASAFVVTGAWMERYLIVVPTLSSPFLTPQRLPSDWTNYHATWVELSITAAAFSTFLLIYTFLSKLFPMVSIWETREAPATVAEPVEEAEEQTIPGIRTQPFMPPPLAMLLIGALVVGLGAVSAKAAETPMNKNAEPTALAVEWEAVPAPASPEAGAASTPSNRVYYYADQVLSPLLSGSKNKAKEEEQPMRALAVTAKLRDSKGGPLAYQAVGFSLQTSFGTLLQYGKVPTDGDGKAKLVLRDRRCGAYPFQAVYSGDQAHKVSYGQAVVDFGPCPAPALPAGGVLITPYRTAGITLILVAFFGTMWVVIFYACSYVVQLRRLGEGGIALPGGPSGSLAPPAAPGS